MSTIVVELYQALREAGVDERLAREAAHAVLGSDMKSELATKTDLSEMRAFMRADLAESTALMKTDLAASIGSMKVELADLRTEMRAGFADLRAEIANSRVEMIKWAVGAMTALAATFAAIARVG